jgi:1A family penicillin-binding protein
MPGTNEPPHRDPDEPASSQGADAATGPVPPDPSADRSRTNHGGGPSVAPEAPGPETSLSEAAQALGRALRQSGGRRLRGIGTGMTTGASAAAARLQSFRTSGGTGSPSAPEATRPAPEPPASRRPPRRSKAPGSRSIRFGWRLFLWSVFLVIFASGTTVVAVWLAMRDLPLADLLPPLDAPTVSVRTADGQTLTTRGAYRAPYVGLDEFPPQLLDAVIAIEDRRFREHSGVDLRGISRALVRNVSAGGVVQGGSTITQQLVKILYLEPERTISRKLQEAVLATTLERQLGKDRILELYLNSVYLGSGAYGMPAAAQTYYGKDVGELSLPEAALLAASIQLPSQVNPIADLGAVQNRGALVLNLMADQGRIDTATRDQALAQMALLAPEPPPARAGSYFADWVLEEVASLEGASSEAITVQASLDQSLQARAEEIVQRIMAEEGPTAGGSQAAVVVMTNTGQVGAMIGGVSYADSQFNRATDAMRQPGSTFKFFVYLAALVRGASPDNTISDEPIQIGTWAPQNFDGRSHGTVTLQEAFAKSYNIAAVRLAQEVGIDAVVEVAQRFGIGSELKATPSLALGTSEVTLLDMTEAYAGLLAGRAPVTASGIATLRFGESGAALNVTAGADTEQTRLQRTREPMLGLLRAVVEDGTGRAAAIPGVDIIGKTGTSQDSRDAWFIGMAVRRNTVIGVWVGNDDNSPMDRVTGGGLPARIFREVMIAALDARGTPAAQVEASAPVETEAPAQCNIRRCAATYRSFNPEDCTYQPFEGPRQLCTR